MCEFCQEHGEGKIWYLNIKNYAKELYNDKLMRSFYDSFVKGTDKKLSLIEKNPALRRFVPQNFTEEMKREHFGQIIPAEDVRKIIDMSLAIVRLPCACAWESKKKEKRVCLGVCAFLPEWFSEHHLKYFGSPDVAKFDHLSRESTAEFIDKLEKETKLIHSVWTIGTPFILGICNCDIKNCFGLRSTKLGLTTLFKSEYVAQINARKCVGCKACIDRCQFGAIWKERSQKKYFINVKKCYGCGICRLGCPKKAITLVSRSGQPVAKDLW